MVAAMVTNLLYVKDFFKNSGLEVINLSQKLGQFVKVMIHHEFLVKVVTGRRQATISATLLPAPRRLT
jgi:hypothetical protein